MTREVKNISKALGILMITFSKLIGRLVKRTFSLATTGFLQLITVLRIPELNPCLIMHQR